MKTPTLIVVVCAILIAAVVVSADAKRLTDHEKCKMMLEPPVGIMEPKELIFSQRLDHYNHQDDRKWNQRYWIEESFWSGAANGGPIFVWLGGEGPENGFSMVTGQMSVYAKAHRALQITIEHRYYGASQPRPDLSTENLQWLSSRQALADAAELIMFVREKYKAYNSPVITFGCSYSGALSSFFRTKYPHLVTGAVASSAPVEATLDYYQYLHVVGKSINYFVGAKCNQAIAAATQQIQRLVQTEEGRREVERKFIICEPLNGKLDITTLMQNLMEVWQAEVQYNEISRSRNVSRLCNKLTNAIDGGQSPIDAYASVVNPFLAPRPCMNCNYQKFVEEVQLPDVEQSMRQWIYQTCTEFAYFQTTDADPTTQPFGDLVPVEFWVDYCADVFGKDFNPAARVKQTNIYFGGAKLPTSIPNNIVFVNGNIDPWHALSIIEPVPHSPLQTVFIKGTSHCADVSLVGPKRAPPQLLAAQQEISNIVGKWIADYKPLPSNSAQ